MTLSFISFAPLAFGQGHLPDPGMNGVGGGGDSVPTDEVGASSDSDSSQPLAGGGGGLVPDCPPSGCGWAELLELAQNIMNFMIAIAIPLSAIAFAWAGFLYLSSAGSEDKIKKAHGIFKKVAIGLFFVLAAWLIVWLIVSVLLKPDFILLRR